MTDKEWEEKLEPLAKLLYKTFTNLDVHRKELEEELVRDFGVAEAYVSVDHSGVRISFSPTKERAVHLNFKE